MITCNNMNINFMTIIHSKYHYLKLQNKPFNCKRHALRPIHKKNNADYDKVRYCKKNFSKLRLLRKILI